jgi:phosphatidylinositol dimannoside acyltransferase
MAGDPGPEPMSSEIAPIEPFRDRLAFWAYRAAEAFALRAPERLGRATVDVAAHLAFRVLPGVRATVAANQSRVSGRAPDDPLVLAVSEEAFELYARYWFDTFRVRAMPHEEVRRRVTVEDLKYLDDALAAGRGCITVLPHMGNWDVAGHWLAISGYRIASVAEELRPHRLFELFLRHREELGIRIVPLIEGTHVGQRLAALLGKNWIVALVADRDLGGRGVEVDMFGAPRRVPAGPALLSLSTGAALLVCPTWTTRDGWHIRIGAPLEIERTASLRDDVAELTRLMAAGFERAIAGRPADWHMFQPAWANDPSA